MLPCDCSVLLRFLRVPALEDVESHWLHLSGFSAPWVIGDNQLPHFNGLAATLCVIGRTKASLKGRQQARHILVSISLPSWFAASPNTKYVFERISHQCDFQSIVIIFNFIFWGFNDGKINDFFFSCHNFAISVELCFQNEHLLLLNGVFAAFNH